MKNRFTLTGTDNYGFRHKYSVKKNEGFRVAFINFMKHLDFNEETISKLFLYEEDSGNIKKLKIADFEDCCRHYKNRNYDVDVFFGYRKIIIVVRTRKREKMVEYLENEAGWISAFEIKKIQEKRIKNEIPIIPLRK